MGRLEQVFEDALKALTPEQAERVRLIADSDPYERRNVYRKPLPPDPRWFPKTVTRHKWSGGTQVRSMQMKAKAKLGL